MSMESIWEVELKIKYVVYGIASFCSLNLILQICLHFLMRMKNYQMQNKAKQYRKQRDESIQQLCIPQNLINKKLSLSIIKRVLQSDITQLKKMLHDNIVTSEDLINIFSYRCQCYGVKYEIITHLKYNEAIQQARECDTLRKQNPSLCNSLLFGIPISIKESFIEKNYPSTGGCISRLEKIEKEDGINVKILKEAGAIPFVRTNVPQLLLTFESMNQIYGRVKNPWDISKLAGGSSGGEGAAIAGRLSPAGLGSDIGGSVRIPASMCGIYGFKPCSQRSIITGEFSASKAQDGQIIIQCVSGPLGSSVDDLILMFKAMTDSNVIQKFKISERNTHIPIIPFNEQELQNDKKQRRFGYFKTLDAVEATVSSQRAVQLAIDFLISQGHEVVEVEIKNSKELDKLFLNVFFADNLETLREILSGEEYADEYKEMEILTHIPDTLKNLIGYILGILGEKRLKESLKNTLPMNVYDYNKVSAEVIEWQKKILAIFEDNSIQAIICPSFGSPALPHGASKNTTILAVYTFMWNIVNFPCGVIPVTVVKEGEQHYQNCPFQDSISKIINNLMQQNTKGLPVGIQVVVPPYREETCLNVMKLIDSGIQFYNSYSYPQF